MFHRIEEIIPLKNMILKIKFKNQKIKYYDVKNVLNKIEEFKVLENVAIFNNVKIDIGGYAIVWNDELDISCEELYNNGFEKI